MSEGKLIRLRIPEMVDKAGTPEQRMQVLLKMKIERDEDYQALGLLFSEDE